MEKKRKSRPRLKPGYRWVCDGEIILDGDLWKLPLNPDAKRWKWFTFPVKLWIGHALEPNQYLMRRLTPGERALMKL